MTVDNVKASTRFGYFSTADEMIIVAGAQEAKECDLGLAYGMKLRKDRRLVLVLPAAYSFATEQREQLSFLWIDLGHAAVSTDGVTSC